MKRLIGAIVVVAATLSLFTGCAQVNETINNLQDGTYRSEFKDFDAYGWKDFVEVTIVDGELYEVVFDAIGSKEDILKSEDEGYKSQMETIVGTYPAKYNQDLINQFIESGKVSAVDVVANATQSTGNFKVLMMSAMVNASEGDTETEIVENRVTK